MTDAEIIAGARVEKRAYSSSPWRIVSADGRQITVPDTMTLPSGQTMPFPALLAYRTKREAVAALTTLRTQYATPEAA